MSSIFHINNLHGPIYYISLQKRVRRLWIYLKCSIDLYTLFFQKLEKKIKRPNGPIVFNFESQKSTLRDVMSPINAQQTNTEGKGVNCFIYFRFKSRYSTAHQFLLNISHISA